MLTDRALCSIATIALLIAAILWVVEKHTGIITPLGLLASLCLVLIERGRQQ